MVNSETLYDEDMDISAPAETVDSSIRRTESMKDVEMGEQMDEDAAISALPMVAQSGDQDDEEMDYSTLKNTIYDQTQVIESIFKIFDSKEFCDKIESTLKELVDQQQALESPSPNTSGSSDRDVDTLNEFCLSASQICNFILVKSQSKIHQSL